ncbi:hypothetical protein PIB30_007603 [Stylosanthes scabra]|uniref:Uncharacterized protein n=1 Tax=Stylosanthes scabra TaxID=79078 RepID=A0ABU6U6A9_9FABA|nr:hypothetical protein [Stylosanthes scabra]
MSLPSNVMSRNDSGRMHGYVNGDSAGTVLQNRDSDSRFPFANSGNPVMALVAFLASAIGPRVAAACAHAALAVLSEDTSGSTSQMELESTGVGVSPEDSNSSTTTQLSRRRLDDEVRLDGHLTTATEKLDGGSNTRLHWRRLSLSLRLSLFFVTVTATRATKSAPLPPSPFPSLPFDPSLSLFDFVCVRFRCGCVPRRF